MSGTIAKTSVIISLISVLNLFLSLLNQIVIAKYFGTSFQLDSFLIASAFPSFFMGIGVSLFSSTIIPILTPVKDKSDEFKKAISSITLVAVLFISLAVFLGFISRNGIIQLFVKLKEENLRLVFELSGYIWLAAGFNIFSSYLISLFNLNKEFLYPSFLLILPTIGMLIGILIFGKSIGIKGMVAGWLAANVISTAFLMPVLFKYKVNIAFAEKGNRYLKEFLNSFLPTLTGLMPFTILLSIDTFWAAGFKEGSLSSIGYCTRIAVSLGLVIANGIYMVIIPYLSENAARNEDEAFLKRMKKTFRYLFFALVPLVIFLIFYRTELITVLLQRGSFTEDSTRSVSALLPFYLIGLLAMQPVTILSRAYFAKRFYKKFSILSISLISFYFIISGILSRYFSIYGIGMTYVLYWSLFFIIGLIWLDSNIIDRDMVLFLLKIAFFSIISVIISSFILKDNYTIHKFFILALRFSVSSVIFLSGALFFKIEEMLFLKSFIFGERKKQ